MPRIQRFVSRSGRCAHPWCTPSGCLASHCRSTSDEASPSTCHREAGARARTGSESSLKEGRCAFGRWASLGVSGVGVGWRRLCAHRSYSPDDSSFVWIEFFSCSSCAMPAPGGCGCFSAAAAERSCASKTKVPSSRAARPRSHASPKFDYELSYNCMMISSPTCVTRRNIRDFVGVSCVNIT